MTVKIFYQKGIQFNGMFYILYLFLHLMFMQDCTHSIPLNLTCMLSLMNDPFCYRQHEKERRQGFSDVRCISHVRAVRSQERGTNCGASSARTGGSLRKNVSTLAQT